MYHGLIAYTLEAATNSERKWGILGSIGSCRGLKSLDSNTLLLDNWKLKGDSG